MMTDVEIQHMWRDACLLALAELPSISPRQLQNILFDRGPEAAWQAIAEGDKSALALPKDSRVSEQTFQRWCASAQRCEPMALLERYGDAGIDLWSSFGVMPDQLIGDPHAPALLFSQGDPTALSKPSVALIGTRHCSHEGRAIAKRFGAELAEAGVSVVSGLALGIDGAAHIGALSVAYGAPPIGIVGSGLDVVYPRKHTALWQDVRERGLLMTEATLGARPEAWRFPARNRIIAGLADVVVVVESHDRGGSLLTVDEALNRGVAVMAVPGSVHNPASRGVNQLLRDGMPPACSTEDILLELDAEFSCRSQASPAEIEIEIEHPADDGDVYEAVDWSLTSTDQVLLRTGLSPGAATAALTRLEQAGWLVHVAGSWQRASR